MCRSFAVGNAILRHSLGSLGFTVAFPGGTAKPKDLFNSTFLPPPSPPNFDRKPTAYFSFAIGHAVLRRSQL